MNKVKDDIKPNLLLSIFQSRCPRCRRGRMFKERNAYKLKTTLRMHEKCPVCGQPLDMEPGFYYGTNMTSYALTVLLSVFTFFLWWVTIGFSLSDNRFFWWIAVNAVLLILLQPPIMRISRTIWLSFFVRYTSRWKEGDIIEQYNVNKQQMNNW